eukprot:3533477-Karenia_brevis.AAC.1
MRLNKKESALEERALRSAPATGKADGGGSETTTRQRLGATRSGAGDARATGRGATEQEARPSTDARLCAARSQK